MRISLVQARERVLLNSGVLMKHLVAMAGSGTAVTTDLVTLAGLTGLDEEDVRTSAAALMIHGHIVDILPSKCGRIQVLLQEA